MQHTSRLRKHVILKAAAAPGLVQPEASYRTSAQHALGYQPAALHWSHAQSAAAHLLCVIGIRPYTLSAAVTGAPPPSARRCPARRRPGPGA
jgi:hypothetical protein